MLLALPHLQELSHCVLSIQVTGFWLGATPAIRGHLSWGVGHLPVSIGAAFCDAKVV